MPIDLYHHPGSPPCLSVRLVAAAAGIKLNLKLIDLIAEEQLKPEYLKVNPQHTVPAIDDDGFILWESHVISCYLIDKYAKNDSLYPKDPKQRAMVDQRLYFDLGTLYNAIREYFHPQLVSGAPADPVKLGKCHEALALVDIFLEGQHYVAGNQMTIADLAIVSNVVSLSLMDSDISRYANISRWLQRIKTKAPKYDEIMVEGVKVLKAFVDQILKK